MHPITARRGMRGMDDLTVEALAPLQQKLDRWIGQRDPQTERMEYPHFRARLHLKKLEGVVEGLQGRVQYGRWHKRRR